MKRREILVNNISNLIKKNELTIHLAYSIGHLLVQEGSSSVRYLGVL